MHSYSDFKVSGCTAIEVEEISDHCADSTVMNMDEEGGFQQESNIPLAILTLRQYRPVSTLDQFFEWHDSEGEELKV